MPLATLPACAELVPQLVLPGVQGVGLAVLKTPLMNCVDGSTDAVSIYAPAAGLLHALARCEEQLNAEFANGASRVFASEDLLRPDAQGRRALQDDLFVGLPGRPGQCRCDGLQPDIAGRAAIWPASRIFCAGVRACWACAAAF